MGERRTRTRAALITALGTLLAALPILLGPALTRAEAATSVSAYGANNWSCRLTTAHPRPIVLVHGTYGDQKSLFETLSWYLTSAGYCVYALDYGKNGTNAVSSNAAELKAFVDKVLASTHATKVSIIGHSQGGMMPRYYIKFLGGAAKVDDLVALAPSNHGTTWKGLLTPVPGYPTCQACKDQMAGSSFLTNLNSVDETPGTVSYTNIVTTRDTVVLPYTSGNLSGPSTTNVTLQNKCASETSDHLKITSSPAAIRIAVNALSRSGPADLAYQPKCVW